MKLGLTVFSAITAGAAAGGTKGFQTLKVKDFDANSKAAQKLLDSSLETRKLEDGWNFDEAFVATHSVVYEGCYNETGWTDNGYQQQSLIRYKLCPTDSCSNGACSSDYYGEYVVDLPTFVDSYMESKLEAVRFQCEQMREQCGCEGENDGCLYYCFKEYNSDIDWKFCSNEQGEEERYGECTNIEDFIQDDDNNRDLEQRRDEYQFYVGPVCNEDGMSINLAVFTDEYCLYEHSSGAYVFELLSGGESLPYSTTSLIESECVSCLEPTEDQNDDDYEDNDEVTMFCEETYNAAARCETYLNNYYKDENGCSIITALENGEYSGYSAYQMGWSAGSTFYAVLFGGVAAVFAVGAFAFVYAKKKKNGNAAHEEELVDQTQYSLS